MILTVELGMSPVPKENSGNCPRFSPHPLIKSILQHDRFECLLGIKICKIRLHMAGEQNYANLMHSKCLANVFKNLFGTQQSQVSILLHVLPFDTGFHRHEVLIFTDKLNAPFIFL